MEQCFFFILFAVRKSNIRDFCFFDKTSCELFLSVNFINNLQNQSTPKAIIQKAIFSLFYLDFQIAIPFRVDNNYRFVSHVVRHKPRNRVRRDVAEENTLRFSLLGFGEEFQIQIEPNHRLLTPKFLITKMKNKVERKMDSDINSGCHYRGWVTSHEGGAVSMSTCKGLVSKIDY